MTTPASALASTQLADAALSSAALSRARDLAEWVGKGKTLTASGVLRPAEAAQACRDLGIQTPGPRLRSALDVHELMRDWLIAVTAGFLEMDARRAWAAHDLSGAGSLSQTDPEAVLTAWVLAATAALDIGDDPCAGCLTVLHELQAADGPLTMDQLADAVLAVLEPEEPEGTPCPGCGEVHGSDDLFRLDGFDEYEYEDDDEEDTAAHIEGTVTGLLAFGAADATDGSVRLTPLGALLAASAFQVRAPSTDADAAAVVSAISELPPAVARTVAGPWLDARSPAGSVRELLAFAESAGSEQRAAALGFARELGPDAMQAWQEWAKRPGIGAYARQWLKLQGEDVAEEPADDAWLAVDALTVMLDAVADTVPPFLLRAMILEELGEDADEAIELMLGSGHPAAKDVAARLTGRPGRRARTRSVSPR